jgi:hypothetical protein
MEVLPAKSDVDGQRLSTCCAHVGQKPEEEDSNQPHDASHGQGLRFEGMWIWICFAINLLGRGGHRGPGGYTNSVMALFYFIYFTAIPQPM